MWFAAWAREMVLLLRKYRQATRDEKKAMSDLKQWMRDNA